MQARTSHTLRLLILALSVALWGGRCGDAQPLDNSWPSDWKLVWVDEFEGSAGQLPDSSKWLFDIGTDWGNRQLEYDTNHPQNVSLDGNGNLAITALKESYEGSDYTSGRINTMERFDQAYGRFEARIRLPVGRGIWPAFWLLGANIKDVNWPACGEIDILEYLGQEPNVIHGSIHGPGYSGGSAITGKFTLPDGAFNDDFHIFAVEWDGTRIDWFMDDTHYQTITTEQLPSGARWVFDHPFFIILNVAVGGNWPGPPDETTVFPQTMLVDWVRVYRAER